MQMNCQSQVAYADLFSHAWPPSFGQQNWTANCYDDLVYYSAHRAYLKDANEVTTQNSLSNNFPSVNGKHNVSVTCEQTPPNRSAVVVADCLSNAKAEQRNHRRTVYSTRQLTELEKEFHFSRYITRERRLELAKQLSMRDSQVKIWFQNRRQTEKRRRREVLESVGHATA